MTTLGEFLSHRANDRRLARLTHDIPLPEARGLEFGAAANPTLVPERISVAYVDHAADANAAMPNAVAVDHVWSGTGAFPGRSQSYDFAIAAQVLQYIPNLLGWLQGVFDVLRPGGVLNLTLPDHRFMFDARRPCSTIGQLLDAFYGQYQRPSPGQVFDHSYGAVAVEPAAFWNGAVDLRSLPRFCGEHALALAAESAARARDGETELCHCWVFSPLGFLDVLADLSRLRLIGFVISEFASTEAGECEFFVCLRRDKEDNPDALLQMQLGALAHVRAIAERRGKLAKALARD